jgi:hypothetical protein
LSTSFDRENKELVRAFALLLVLLNIVPLGVDAIGDAVGRAAPQESAPCAGCDGDGDDDCFPGCADCVCSSIGVRLLAPATPHLAFAPSLEPLPTVTLGPVVVDVTGPPRAPAASGVFHPPKA